MKSNMILQTYAEPAQQHKSRIFMKRWAENPLMQYEMKKDLKHY